VASTGPSRPGWLVAAGAIVVLAIAAAGVAGARACSRSHARTPAGSPAGRSAAQVVRVPPPLPGEPPLGTDYDTMLQRFAANISQGLYTRANLELLLCNSEKGFRMLNPSMDPRVAAMMRRMVALFRSAPGMAHTTCP
jgi:hypothetical protein